MVLNSFFDVVFGPLLVLPTLWAVIILSFVISLIITIIYKYATNQTLMKELKDEMKGYQKQIKEHKKEPEKALSIQKKMMESNMKYMRQSFKSMIYTFIPIILIFGWMSANLAFVPLMEDVPFNITLTFEPGAEGTILVRAPAGLDIVGDDEEEIIGNAMVRSFNPKNEGLYLIEFDTGKGIETKQVLVTSGQKYEAVERTKKRGFGFFAPDEPFIAEESKISSITVNHQQKKILNLFGWRLGWLGAYILFSIVFSIGIRKIVKVY